MMLCPWSPLSLHPSSFLPPSCSGGNRRKLSTAIALVGSPPIVFLVGCITIMSSSLSCFLHRCVISTVMSSSLSCHQHRHVISTVMSSFTCGSSCPCTYVCPVLEQPSTVSKEFLCSYHCFVRACSSDVPILLYIII